MAVFIFRRFPKIPPWNDATASVPQWSQFGEKFNLCADSRSGSSLMDLSTKQLLIAMRSLTGNHVSLASTDTRPLLLRSLSDKWKDAYVVWRCAYRYGRFLHDIYPLSFFLSLSLPRVGSILRENGEPCVERERTRYGLSYRNAGIEQKLPSLTLLRSKFHRIARYLKISNV